MTCTDSEAAIARYISSGSAATLGQARAHLTDCTACLKRLATLVYAEMALGERDLEITPDIRSLLTGTETEDVLAQVLSRPNRPRRKRRSPWFWLLVGLGLALATGWTLSLFGAI